MQDEPERKSHAANILSNNLSLISHRESYSLDICISSLSFLFYPLR